jgi:hypothetical protein
VEDGSVYTILKERQTGLGQITVELYLSSIIEIAESEDKKVISKSVITK